MTVDLDEIVERPAPGEPERDGIGEEDNPIPRWFNVSFAATIVFAGFYIPYYVLSGWSSAGQWEAQVKSAEAAVAATSPAMPTENPYHGDPAAIAEGKQTFDTICMACHKADGSGLVGPSLVDPYWKYGHDDATLFETVSKGRPGGMPPWGTQLGTEKIWKVLAYVKTLPKSDKPGVGSPDYVAPTPTPTPAPAPAPAP
jgi:cytochrome c oxidase cbb3-type subunit 3